ncbi:leukocyte surface antigen CD53 [Ornithorhynchus anatinus]|uniref:Tetraspanin n=1 Tax=Ornithorhynchus anatinus TaxID=9258 RepID=F6VK90_ORNAN|nr:leukocyte surface antigen CD53 [Ornithorhynchus anatinus]XP_039768419.1 leukocyte surface antigen CD53 [Ornithorhynchus anatinus]
MAASSLKVLKYVLFFFNLLFWVCGCCILGFGIYLLILDTYGALIQQLPSLTLGNVLIIVGCVIMVLAFLGCMGAIKENKCLLMSFFVILLLILLAEVILAILLFMYEKKVDDYVNTELKDSFQHYHKDNATKNAWDAVQQQLQCCGVNNGTDWNGPRPDSCPKETDVQGCYQLIKEWFQANFLYIGIFIICVCVIQVLGMSFALTLYCQVEKTSNSMSL